ncbi:MAG: hypothetical protein JJ850_10380 [Kordiimonadaceae bacterium]|nr:hypothetical protein [Kordiimonadaceae bacterium]MBO6569541.1 hypothetical protein [Kordiimonadaceae bacterium]MBO6965016.1 hypothetical protein [Kordiimonadaceae bacterium]
MKPTLAGMLLLLFATPLFAQEDGTPAATRDTLKIVALEIPWLLHTKTPGPYNDLMDELLDGFNAPLEVSILPVRRALREFFAGSAHCYFAGNYNDAFLEIGGVKREDLVFTKPFNRSSIRVFTASNEPAVRTLAELDNSTISIDAAVGAVEAVKNSLPKSVRTMVAENVAQSHALLSQGRVTASIMVHYDYRLFTAHDQAEPQLHYDDALVIDAIEDKLMCKSGTTPERLVEHVNTRIDALARSGQLAQTLAPDYARSRRQFAERPHPYLLLNQLNRR